MILLSHLFRTFLQGDDKNGQYTDTSAVNLFMGTECHFGCGYRMNEIMNYNAQFAVNNKIITKFRKFQIAIPNFNHWKIMISM